MQALATSPGVTHPQLDCVRFATETVEAFTARQSNYAQEAKIGWLKTRPTLLPVSEYAQAQFFALTEIVTRCRSGKFDEASINESEEGPTRLAKQLHVIASMRALADGRNEISPVDMTLVRNVARDTLPPTRLALLQGLFNRVEDGSPGRNISQLAAACHIQHTPLDNLLNHYLRQGFVKRIVGASSPTPLWALADDAKEDLANAALLGD